jgi:guanylate kinase
MSRTVFLIAGPSGSGKTSLTQALLARVDGLSKAVTVTTRQQREGEVNGVHYFFVDRELFMAMDVAGDFLEIDYTYNEWYAVPRSALDSEGDIAIIVTVPGTLTLKRSLPDVKTLFVLPPCARTAARRVEARACPNAIERIANYEAEIAAAQYFDHVFLNMDFEQTLQQMQDYVLSCRQENHRRYSMCSRTR